MSILTEKQIRKATSELVHTLSIYDLEEMANVLFKACFLDELERDIEADPDSKEFMIEVNDIRIIKTYLENIELFAESKEGFHLDIIDTINSPIDISKALDHLKYIDQD